MSTKIEFNQTLEMLPIAIVFEINTLLIPDEFVCSKKNIQMIANKLNAVLLKTYPDIKKVSVITIGALYDQSQIIRPQFPIFTALAEIAKAAIQGHEFTPNCIAIGTEDIFSANILNPEKKMHAPILQLPILLLGKTNDIASLTADLETTLMQDVNVSKEITNIFETTFGLKISNIGFATLADTIGMLASQLIQIGLEPLWHLLKSGLFNSTANYLAQLETGHRLLWDSTEEMVRIFECSSKAYTKTQQAKSQSFEQYQQINLRFKLLLTSHNIKFAPFVISEPAILNTPLALDTALTLIKQQVKAL